LAGLAVVIARCRRRAKIGAEVEEIVLRTRQRRFGIIARPCKRVWKSSC
jgi:hypothetical protein